MKKLLIAAAIVSLAALSASAYAADAPAIPIIVKDTTSFYWQIVLAGARKAGKDLGVNVPELGAQSESDINGQISILENAVSGKPAAIVISPTQFAALGKPIDEAAKKVKIIGIDSSADSKAFTSFLPNTARRRATSRSSPRCGASARSTRAPRASRNRSRPNIPA
jgi:ribose transport system substrate-binding protein